MVTSPPIQFCNLCGKSVTLKIPDGDNRRRHVCTSCGEIQYSNPKVVTGCIPVWQDRVLLCRRAIEPRHGFWTVPAGFMENNETLQEGAARETLEEALAPVSDVSLYGIYNLPHISQIYMLFRAELKSEDGFGVGEESLETALFLEEDIPWDQLAFRVVDAALKRFFVERKNNLFTVEITDIR